jgi:aldehyde:ferredoxin oxidoreductase
MLDLYYSMAGWDNEGVPTPGKLAELDLLWAAETAAQPA